ncbi:HEPN domain-containing protein [Methylobacterium sp. E-066]|uniref:HEPN domain-containing protein n=1 Tax=Methylobacterium sp. E-066 TaxID=2836584 RepID=UPI001FB8BAD3|nr:HEPN domain-containing protein [Methylobacterium sp. E-066]MCJ2142270.1 HEPN domain-containing protein [Methylobacterium sp. E-066]
MSASDPREWVRKAQQDTRSARRLLLDPPELEDAAFHVHQAVEKAAKAILVSEGIRYPRGRGAGHDLDALARLIPSSSPFHAQAQQLAGLTPWATAFRYPADDPLTAEPLPAKSELERHLDAAEAFVDAVARQVINVF